MAKGPTRPASSYPIHLGYPPLVQSQYPQQLVSSLYNKAFSTLNEGNDSPFVHSSYPQQQQHFQALYHHQQQQYVNANYPNFNTN
ncbi:unnamed protein product, partial [Didymodactylos carnosus]